MVGRREGAREEGRGEKERERVALVFLRLNNTVT